MYHYRKTRNTYVTHNRNDKQSDECPLCLNDTVMKAIDELGTMLVVPNRVSYDIFEGQRVKDHLMIVPKRHVLSVADFTDEEHLDMGKLFGKYEAEGYNIYARGVGSTTRSVAHQHTHLIKLDGKSSRAVVYLKKPYFLLDI